MWNPSAMAGHRISVRLDDDARRGLDSVTKGRGVSMTALFEAIGRLVDQREIELPEQVIDLALEIDFERQRRR